MIGLKVVRDDTDKLVSFLKKLKNLKFNNILDKYGKMGVELLSENTPVDTGKTADSWFYEIETKGDTSTISWMNSNVVNGVSIALILQYGHGTKNGGYVKGINYIKPSIRPVFEQMVNELREEVSRI